MTDPLANIRVVLVRTFHPGNIGSVARAMKTMGLSDLALAAPRDFPHPEAAKMAASAQDLLNAATVTETLSDAIQDCTVVAATSARPRGYDLPKLSPQDAAGLLLEHAVRSKVALVFGPERMGLHNDDLRLARYRVEIPACSSYPSLNLAAAVQILSYELFKQWSLQAPAQDGLDPNAEVRELPTAETLEHLHNHLSSVLRRIRFLRTHEGETLLRIRNLLHRAEPNVTEVNILRGILRAVEKNLASQDT